MIPPTRLARILAARRQKARSKPPRPTLPNQAERIYLGALRRYSDRLEQLTREAILASDWAPVLRTDARAPGPMRFVSRASRMLDGVRVQLSQETRRLPYDDTAAAVTRHAKTQALKVVGIKPEQFTTGAAVAGWREKNVALVTRMTDDQLSRISDILDQYDGATPFDLADQLQKEFDLTRARSELIARDQVLKLNGDLTAEAHRQAGIEEYTWSTSKDQSVRDRHADLEGTRQRWDDPPVINDQGETGNPGDDYQCRCVPIPYLPELEEGPETGPIATQDYQQAAASVGEQVQATESESGLSALRDYVTSSAAINTLMRDLFAGTVVAAESKALGAIEDLGDEFRAAKRKAALSGTVYRGERIHSEDRWEEFAPGKILTYPQYTSTTLSPLEAGTYTGSGRGVLLEIDQTGGVPVGGLAGLGKVSREVLLSPGKYRVISRRVTGDKIRVKVRRI